MELRDYQQTAIDRLKEALLQGSKRPVVQAPTGAGKTVIAAAIVNLARQKDKRVLFCVPALSLINQTVERFRASAIFDVGVIQGLHEMTDGTQPVQVCSIQTLARREIPKADLVIIDECFAAGTMVLTPDGEKSIETFLPGDKILCATGEGYVVSVSRKMSKTMTLRFSNGRSVRVTPEHPFFTEAGWTKAQDMGLGQNVFSEEGLHSLWNRNNTKSIPQRSAGSGAHLEQARILLNLLCEEACQPDEQKCNSFENARYFIEDQARSYFSRRERSSLAIAAIGASSCFGRRLASRGSDTYKNDTGFGLSDELQTGHSQCGNKVGNRNRRWKPLWTAKNFGSEKDGPFGDIRLEGITIDERASDEPVFNLHVAGHPSYFAEGVLVHNCHILFKLFDTWMNDPEWAKVPFVGLTATPWAKGMGAPGRWDRLIIGTTTEELINLKHLSDFKCYAPAHPDLSGVKTKLGDYEMKGLGEAMDKNALVADIVSTWLERGENRSTICFAVNRVHAKHIETQFKEAGVSVEYMDAFTDLEERAAIVDRFAKGDTKIICNVGVLTTGFDADVRCIILARPTKSEILYTQMIGRGLRTANGKDHCIARGSKILTDKGEVNIEDVTLDHKVWDGVDWVSHAGAVCRGVQPVIQYAGLTATTDHLVMADGGWKTFEAASRGQSRIAVTGVGGKPIRFLDDRWAGNSWVNGQASGPCQMQQMPDGSHGSFPQHQEKAEYKSLPILQSKKGSIGALLVISEMSGSAISLQQSVRQGVSALWRAWDQVSFHVFKCCRMLDCRQSWGGKSRNAIGQDRQQWALRAGEPTLDGFRCEYEQHPQEQRWSGEIRPIQNQLSAYQICGSDLKTSNLNWIDGQRDSSEMGNAIAQAEREVWDILNAGPLQRFTANGLLVHNCLILDHSDTTLRLGFVTDIHKSELHDGVANRATTERKAPLPKECSECHFLKPPKMVKCPACGFQPKPQNKVEAQDGELYEIGRNKQIKTTAPTPQMQQRWFSELVKYAEVRGYKNGWAAYAFKDKFGTFPPNWLEHKPASLLSPEVSNWITARNIRNAKSKFKVGIR